MPYTAQSSHARSVTRSVRLGLNPALVRGPRAVVASPTNAKCETVRMLPRPATRTCSGGRISCLRTAGALVLEQEGEVLAALCGVRMLGTLHLLADRQRALQARLRRRQVTLVHEQVGEVVEARRGVRMTGAEYLLADCQRALLERPRRRQVALVAEQAAEEGACLYRRLRTGCGPIGRFSRRERRTGGDGSRGTAQRAAFREAHRSLGPLGISSTYIQTS